MHVDLEPGSYVLAVSGGVDSVVLLHLLAGRVELNLTVAHFDHGMRPGSAKDANFVRQLAAAYNLPFYSQRVELGPSSSEAAARSVRYSFLHGVQAKVGAQAIITAHHQDDVLETAILNLRRGTGRRGLTSLQSTPAIKRPLLDTPKAEIISYATQHSLSWREDTTNYDTRFTRNYIRHRLLANFSPDQRQRLLAIVERLRPLNQQLDSLLADSLQQHSSLAGLDRQWFKGLPIDVSKEVMASWLRQNQLADFDRPTINRLAAGAQMLPTGKRLDVRHGRSVVIKRASLALQLTER